MQTQAKILEEKITDSGWQIVHKFEMPEWWADEIWQLESIWSPIGHSAWITFLVDPENDIARRKGQHVWAVGVSAQKPGDRVSTRFEDTMALNTGWRKDLGNFINKLNNLREML